MSRTDSFSVVLIGFSEYEKKLFGSIATLTKGRTRSYRLADDLLGRADIVVVDGDDPGALREWQKRCASAGEQPSLVVSKSSPQQAGAVHIRRPLIFTRVVAALDQLAIQDLKSAPDLVIKQGADVSPEINNMLKHMRGVPVRGTRRRALVVDDSASVRKLMEIELRISGIAGDFAESAEAAWRLLARNSYDIVFLDVVLPDVDGYQICKSIRKDRSTKHMPVIMLTGKSSPFDRIKGRLAGCNSYLVKPVTHKALQKVFQRYLPAEVDKADHRSLGVMTPSLVKV